MENEPLWSSLHHSFLQTKIGKNIEITHNPRLLGSIETIYDPINVTVDAQKEIQIVGVKRNQITAGTSFNAKVVIEDIRKILTGTSEDLSYVYKKLKGFGADVNCPTIRFDPVQYTTFNREDNFSRFYIETSKFGMGVSYSWADTFDIQKLPKQVILKFLPIDTDKVDIGIGGAVGANINGKLSGVDERRNDKEAFEEIGIEASLTGTGSVAAAAFVKFIPSDFIQFKLSASVGTSLSLGGEYLYKPGPELDQFSLVGKWEPLKIKGSGLIEGVGYELVMFNVDYDLVEDVVFDHVWTLTY